MLSLEVDTGEQDTNSAGSAVDDEEAQTREDVTSFGTRPGTDVEDREPTPSKQAGQSWLAAWRSR